MCTWFLRFPAPPAATLVESPPQARAPTLERMLSRADARAALPDWRREAFELIAAPGEPWPGVCAPAVLREFGVLDAAAVYLATPVHYVATMTRVHLAADGLIALQAAEAARLATDFNRAFGPGEQLLASPSGALYCRFERPLLAETHDPAQILGQDIGPYQARGRDAAALRRLASEIEMWLHEHAINRARESRGAARLGGLWLWGGGEPLERSPRLSGWADGEDVLFAALNHAGEAGRETRSGVVCVAATPGSPDWLSVETRWLLPAMRALAARRIGRLMLSAGAHTHVLDTGSRRRFWRRARPWWEYLG